MMKIIFEIYEYPLSNEKYRLISNTEGKLTISINNINLFSSNEILIIEFARILNNFIEKNNTSYNNEFIYKSMDFEEDPLIKIIIKSNDEIIFYNGITSEEKTIIVNRDVFFKTCKEFLNALKRQLKEDGIPIEKYHSF